MGLGDLPGGDVYIEAAIVWANGSVVFGTSEIIDDDEEAFRWTNAGGMVGLGLLPGGSFDYSYANAASADGRSVTRRQSIATSLYKPENGPSVMGVFGGHF